MTPRTKSGTLRGCTIPAFTIYGGRGRAQVVVYTTTDESTHFCVNTLRASYHPSTAFKSRAGVCRYNGPDPHEAIRVAQEYTGTNQVPSGFRAYLSERALIDVLADDPESAR
jgi:hypothetical protein